MPDCAFLRSWSAGEPRWRRSSASVGIEPDPPIVPAWPPCYLPSMRSAPPKRVTLAEFLDWERLQSTRHELIDGEIVAMTGARAGHVRMVARLMERLRRHLRGSPCEAFANDLRIVVPLGDSYYPDILVVCGEARPRDEDDQVGLATIAIEVSSPSTWRHDAQRKRWGYLSVPTLEHYLLIDPAQVGAEIVSRNEDRAYRGTLMLRADDVLELPAIGFSVRLGDLYAD
jgi:Uma2 family endonuclease